MRFGTSDGVAGLRERDMILVKQTLERRKKMKNSCLMIECSMPE